MKARLPVRLFASYALVVAVGAAAAYLAARLLVPPLFDHRHARTGRQGEGWPVTTPTARESAPLSSRH